VALGGRPSRAGGWLALLALLLVKTRVEETALIARFPRYRSYTSAFQDLERIEEC